MRRPFKWLYPGLKVKRWLLLIVLGVAFVLMGMILITRFGVLVGLLSLMKGFTKEWLTQPWGRFLGVLVLGIGLFSIVFGFKKMLNSILHVALPSNPEKLVEVLYNHRSLKKGPKIVALGGGTGLPILLRGLKEYTSNLTAIVSMADDGGSSGRLRGELGILPPGDLRNCLIALADREQVMEDLLGYRFQQGSSLAGHNLGNLLLAGLAELRGDFNIAVQELSRVLAVKGRVLPATLTSTILGAKLANGEQVFGESRIAQSKAAIEKVFLKPPNCSPLPEALQAIKDADLIVLGPGSLFTSVIPNLLIEEIREAILSASAPVVYVCNVAVQPGETTGFLASDHLKALQAHGSKEIVDLVLVNIAPYRGKGKEMASTPVAVDLAELEKLGVEVLGEDLLNQKTGIHHDEKKLARQLIRIIFWQKNHRDRLKMLDLYFQDRFRRLIDL